MLKSRDILNCAIVIPPEKSKVLMNHPAASGRVSKLKSTAKVYAPKGGELDPERLRFVFGVSEV